MFKKRNLNVDDEPIPYNIPATYGAEYDEYDYFYTKLPRNSREWTRWGYKCSECGKHHKLNCVYTEYFYTLDGYDSLSSEVCWMCELKSIIHKPVYKIKRNIKFIKEMFKLKKEYHNYNCKLTWKKCYELTKKLNK